MPRNLKVVYTSGVPVAADFNASDGPPLCINQATGIAYYLTSAGVVTAIPPNLDSVGATQGQILYRGAAAWAALAAGTSGQFLQTLGAGANPAWAGFSPIRASLGADVALNNTANFFDGPSIAQGTAGTWYASGTVTLEDPTAALLFVKLWDGTTVVSSAADFVIGGLAVTVALSGFIASPASDLKISVRDVSNATGLIKFNRTGESRDSTITAIRIG